MSDNATKCAICDCGGMDLLQGQSMSRFNKQIIYLECADREQLVHGYISAKKSKQDAVLRGDYNFQGVGR